jgi:hypothetical protein
MLCRALGEEKMSTLKLGPSLTLNLGVITSMSSNPINPRNHDSANMLPKNSVALFRYQER